MTTPTIAELQADLETLKAARRTGAKSLQFGSGSSARIVEYRSDAELVRAIEATESEIATLQHAARPKNVVFRAPPFRGW
jgi:hypothetical protein